MSSDIERGFTEVIAVRHGLTEANAAGVLQGHHDSRLDPLGVAQAECLARRLAGEVFDAIYCSDLSRAFDTAMIVSGRCGVKAEPVTALREWHLGLMENLSYDEARKLYPEAMEAFKYDAADIAIPDGESKREFYVRIASFMDEVADRHVGRRILLVTHGGALQAMLKHVLGDGNVWDFLPRSSNTGYNKFVRREKKWQLCCWNDTSHLPGESVEL